MRQLSKILPPIALMMCALAFGACQSHETFDGAMLSTITDLRSGDLDGASASLAGARGSAANESERKKVKELELLISGAEAYCRGDRAEAGATWSDTKAPEFQRAISANQQSLGIAFAPTNKN